jgi:hypothetical protein
MGLKITSGSCTLVKDAGNLVGISIGGGAPLCQCLYIVQVFDNSPASRDGSLAAGDEIVGVNNKLVKGKTKVEVARMIQSEAEKVTINYNKLHADQKQGKTLDIVLKKIKHKIVEKMSSTTADTLGLSRAILCNDGLIKKLDELDRTTDLYKGLMDHTKLLLKSIFELSSTHKAFGDCFASIASREQQKKASESFIKFGEAHRQIDKYAHGLLKTLKPMISDLNTYLTKAIPDTRLTIQKYADVKFEYLSYCLKVKEMDDEELNCINLQEPLYRVETGNYEYRLVLRCRQLARVKFAKQRQDVLVKLELLDQKHVQDIVFQLHRFITSMAKYHSDCHEMMKPIINIFPIEVDLSENMLNYNYNAVQKPDDSYKDIPEDQKTEENESSDTSEENDEEFEDSNDFIKDEKLLDLSLN